VRIDSDNDRLLDRSHFRFDISLTLTHKHIKATLSSVDLNDMG